MAMTNSLNGIQTSADALATVGAPIPNSDIIGYTLNRLDYNYIKIHNLLSRLKLGMTFSLMNLFPF